MDSLTILAALLLVIPAVVVYRFAFSTRTTTTSPDQPAESEKKTDEEPKTIMQPARTDLAPPKDDPFTQEQLREFDGSDPEKPIYVAIKGYPNIPYLHDVLCAEF